MLSVNTYDEFLKVVECIADSYSTQPKQFSLDEPNVVVLVGPSGSGKSKIATQVLSKTDRFEKLISYTTKDLTALKENDWYSYVDKQTFFEMLENGKFFESTMYAGHGFASRKSDVDALLKKNKIVLATMDICGAMSLKTNYKDVVTVYIKRDKKQLLQSILEKNSTNEDKVNRIISIDDEKRNEEICDFVVDSTDYKVAADKILELLGIE